MHVWLSDAGEPLPIRKGERLLRYGELSRYLAASGHRVTWWVSDFSHRDKTFVGKAGTSRDVDGVDIRFVHGPGYRRNVGLERLVHISIHARNLRKTITGLDAPDVIVSGMPTTEASEVMVDFAKIHGVPIVVDVRDEWPEDYVRWLPGPLKGLGRIVLRPKFRQLERVCRSATALFGVTERQLNYGLQYSGRSRSPTDSVIYTGARLPKLDSRRKAELVDEWRAKGIGGDGFICLFAGTMSPSRPLAPVIDAVMKLSEHIPITLVIAGNGDSEKEYRLRVNGHRAIQFAGWVGHESLSVLMQLADVLIAPYHPAFGFSMPTKMFDYMAAGRPIVSSCPGEARALIERFEFGINYPFDDSAAVERALMDLYDDPDRRAVMGAAARQLFDEQFDLDTIVRTYTKKLQGIVDCHANQSSPGNMLVN